MSSLRALLTVTLISVLPAITLSGTSAQNAAHKGLEAVGQAFDTTARTSLSGKYYFRKHDTLVRNGPGEHFSASYKVADTNLAQRVVGKFSMNNEDWYEMEFGSDRSGFVKRSELLSEENYARKRRLRDFTENLSDWVDKVRSESKGPLARYTGFYRFSPKECDRSENPLTLPITLGRGTVFIWFSDDTMNLRWMDGESTPTSGRIAPSRITTDKGVSTQWYSWNDEQMGFPDGEYAFDVKFNGQKITYRYAVPCKDDDEQIQGVFRNISLIINALPTD